MKDYQIVIRYKNLPTQYQDYSCLHSLHRRFVNEFEYGFSDRVLEIIVKKRMPKYHKILDVVAHYRDGQNPKKFLGQLEQLEQLERGMAC